MFVVISRGVCVCVCEANELAEAVNAPRIVYKENKTVK